MLAAANYVATACQLLRGFVLAPLLGPSGLGSVALIGIVVTYAGYADVGIALATGREIPLSLGQADASAVLRWRWYAVASKLTAGAVIAAGLCAVVLIWGNAMPREIRFGLLTSIAVVIGQGYTTAWTVICQAEQHFGRVGVLVSATAGLGLVLGVAGAYWRGVTGVFVAQATAFLLVAVLCLAMNGSTGRLRPNSHDVGLLLRIGAPLALLNLVAYNLVYVDQVMVVTLLGTAALGVYSSSTPVRPCISFLRHLPAS